MKEAYDNMNYETPHSQLEKLMGKSIPEALKSLKSLASTESPLLSHSEEPTYLDDMPLLQADHPEETGQSHVVEMSLPDTSARSDTAVHE
jgi:hypothetical protein